MMDEETGNNPKRKRMKKKKKMASLQIKDANRNRPTGTSQRQRQRSQVRITNSASNLGDDWGHLRWFVMIMNGILFPVTGWVGLGVHIMALLGGLQLELSLLVPAWLYLVSMWCFWISYFLVTDPPYYPNPFGLLLYPFLIFAQGKLIYLLIRQR